MNRMTMPGFTAAASLYDGGQHYHGKKRRPIDQQVVAQSKMTCAFKAGRLAGRCLQLGHEHGACMEAAADFNQFCNEHDL